MLIFVYGEDQFRVSQKVAQLKDSFRQKFDGIGMNLSEFGPKAQSGEVLSSIRSGGLLSPKRMVVIEGLVETLKTPEVKIWERALCHTDVDAIVVLRETLSGKQFDGQPLAKALKEAEDRHNYVFEKLSDRDLERWIISEMKEHQAVIELPALRELVAMTLGDTWLLSGEIEKLSAYASGKPVTQAMVSELVHGNFEGQIFAFIDAVSQKNTKEAMRLLENERASGSADGYLLQMLLRQVRLLLGAKGLLDGDPSIGKEEVAKVLGAHPFVAQKVLSQARRFAMKPLVEAHDLLFEYDQKTKQGVDPGLAVERVMTALLQN